MSQSDIAVQSADLLSKLATHSQIQMKTPYLVKLVNFCSKIPNETLFLTVDTVIKQQYGIEVKGIYVEKASEEEKISTSPGEYVKSIPREKVVEVMIPWHNVISIRNLIYKAKENKPNDKLNQ